LVYRSLGDNHYIRQTCRLCRSEDLVRVLKLTPTALCDAYTKVQKSAEVYPLNLYLCRDCGFVQIDCVVDPETIYRDYLFVTTSSLPLQKHFESYAKDIVMRLSGRADPLVVDLGSNEGTLLREVSKLGLRVLGVEPAIEIAEKANRDGVPTLPEFFDKKIVEYVKQTHGLADAVTVNNLFANVDDLHSFVANVKDILKPGGLFIVESSYLGDMIENMVFDFIYHEHLSYLSVKPLKKFFEQQEMSLIDVLRVDTKGGSLRYYARNLSTDNSTTLKVDEWLKLENKKELYEITRYDQYAEKILKGKSDLNGFLSNYQKESVIGYGASATSTTLIYHYDLSNKLDCLVDDNPAKVSTFSPGLNIPVRETKEIYRAGVEVVVILAWRYAKEIIQKHSRFNGVFVIPLPELVIHQES